TTEGDDGLRAAALAVTQRDRLHRGTGLHRCQEDAGVEWAYLLAAAGAAFGKHTDATPGLEPGQHFTQHSAQRLRVAARMEDGVGPLRHPADQRPAADLALGDEAHHSLAVQGDDVEP